MGRTGLKSLPSPVLGAGPGCGASPTHTHLRSAWALVLSMASHCGSLLSGLSPLVASSAWAFMEKPHRDPPARHGSCQGLQVPCPSPALRQHSPQGKRT